MTKKKPKSGAKPDSGYPRYLYVRAVLDGCGSLRWEYQLPGGPAVRMSHDENVSAWTDAEIVRLTRDMLALQEGEAVEVVWQ